MRPDEPAHVEQIGPREWLKAVPFEADAASDRLGWAGFRAWIDQGAEWPKDVLLTSPKIEK
jgi:hypothetical protein